MMNEAIVIMVLTMAINFMLWCWVYALTKDLTKARSEVEQMFDRLSARIFLMEVRDDRNEQ